jgi:hypothetical protein
MSPRKAAPPPQDGLLDLLGGPAVPEVTVEKPDPLWGSLDVKWSKPPAGRHLCQDCVDLIHGKEGGTSPLVATRRRRAPLGSDNPDSDRLLCNAHAQIRDDEDQRVLRVHAARIAANKAAQKAALAAKGYGKTREHS